jgi:hypothetical protein
MTNIVELYSPAFEEVYKHDKENLCRMLQVQIEGVYRIRKIIQRHAKDIHNGKLDYFNTNGNLVAIIRTIEDQFEKLVVSKEVSKRQELFCLAVPIFDFNYILMYKSKD